MIVWQRINTYPRSDGRATHGEMGNHKKREQVFELEDIQTTELDSVNVQRTMRMVSRRSPLRA